MAVLEKNLTNIIAISTILLLLIFPVFGSEDELHVTSSTEGVDDQGSKHDINDLTTHQLDPSEILKSVVEHKSDISYKVIDGDLEEKELDTTDYVNYEYESGPASIPVQIQSTSHALTFEDLIEDIIDNSKCDRHDVSLVSLKRHQITFTDPNVELARNVSERGRKIACVGRNITENTTLTVKIINSTMLLQKLSLKNETTGNCAVVMFYAPWCVFCAKTAPFYNALARAFPQLDVLAIDAIHFSNLNARFGTIAVPNILLFHNSKAVARFNGTERNLENMISFVKNVTGLEPNETAEMMPSDHEGPLSSVPSNEPDYLLWLSWAFVITFSAVIFSKSSTGQRIIETVRDFGHEHHHHID